MEKSENYKMLLAPTRNWMGISRTSIIFYSCLAYISLVFFLQDDTRL